jgi:copper(I)-binding protein
MTRPIHSFASFLLACAAALGPVMSLAQPAPAIDVTNAWVRATVPGQGGTGAFMTLMSHAGAKLVGVSTPVAGVAEVHEMKMEGNTMKMRAVPSIELPAHASVELKPGGYHLMLMDLKQPLSHGTSVPVTLQFEDAKGVRSSLDVSLPVRTAAGAPAPAREHKH